VGGAGSGGGRRGVSIGTVKVREMNRIQVIATFLIGSLLSGPALLAQQMFELNGFNNQGMQMLSDGFQQQLGSAAVRLFDDADGYGVASSTFGSPVDLSDFVSGTLNVRHNPLAGHGTDFMSVNLFDSAARSLSYTVDTTRPTLAGDFGMYNDQLPLASPSGGSVGFGEFDFSSVASWSITGQPGSAGPFNERIFGIELEGPDPPVEYGGRDLNSPWRAQAAQMIEQNRKSDLALRVVDANGNSIPGAMVHVNQTRQAFQFGTAVAVSNLLDPGSNNDIYRDTVRELFNSATLENGLKWVALEGEFGPSFSLARSVQALDWLGENGLESRGHVLIWPGSQNMPNYLDPLIAAAQGGDAQAQAELLQEIDDHIREVVAATDGKVVDWDVVNEIGTNNDVLNIYGQPVMDQWFQAARDTDPEAALYINEFNIISDQQRSKRASYLSQIQGLVNRGAQIDAIGFQGHFSATSITDFDDTGGTDPQTVWEIFDQFHDATGLPIKITEYDMNSPNETLKAEHLRDMLTASFAHEGVEGFIMWGFWEGRHWRPDSAMFNQDWSETPAVQVWRDLVLDQWMTDEMLVSTVDGIDLRAFHGDYEILVDYLGETYTFALTLGEDGLAMDLVIPVPILPGDYNDDGVVGAADYIVWRNNHGTDAVLPNDTTPGDVSTADYSVWVANHGSSAGGSVSGQAVPEPAGATVLAVVAAILISVRRRCGVSC
jgi:GH35 family endo-1,4-beta-xylanase